MKSLLPPNQTDLEGKLEACFSVWDFFARDDGSNLIDELFFSLWSPEKIPAPLLGFLAYGFGVRIWEESWPEQQKRDFISAFLLLRLKQGTRNSIIEAARYLGINVQIVDTPRPFETRFVIDTTGGVNIPTRDILKTIRAIAEEFTPLRCRVILETIASFPLPTLMDFRLRRIKIKDFSMASDPRALLTEKGKAAIAKALADGTKIDFDVMKLGREKYQPEESQTAMRSQETESFTIQDFRPRPDGRGVQIGSIAKSDKAYEIGEIGIFLSDGTLFAIVSRPSQALTSKADGEEVILGFDLSFDNDLTGKISTSNSGSLLNLSVVDDVAALGAVLSSQQALIAELTARIAALEARP